MRSLLVASFDTGVTCSLDDSFKGVLSDERLSKLLSRYCAQLADDSAVVDGLISGVGNGVGFFFDSGEILDSLGEARSFRLVLYGIGVGYLEIELDGDVGTGGQLLSAMDRCEDFAYGEFSKGLMSFLRDFYGILDECGVCSLLLCRSSVISCDPYYLISGFTCIIVSDVGVCSDEIISVFQEYERQHEYRVLELDDGVLRLGWASLVFCPREGRSADRVLNLIQMSQIYYCICRSFMYLFSRQLSKTVLDVSSFDFRSSKTFSFYAFQKKINFDVYRFSDVEFDEFVKDILKLKNVSSALPLLLSYRTATDNISDIYYFENFEFFAKTKDLLKEIDAASSVFSTIHAEMLRCKEIVHSRRVSRMVTFITACSVFAMVASIISFVFQAGVTAFYGVAFLTFIMIFVALYDNLFSFKIIGERNDL